MSLNQSLIIYRFPTLFKILNEIKSNLNFNIEHFNNYKFKDISNEVNLVVLSSENKIRFQIQLGFLKFYLMSQD